MFYIKKNNSYYPHQDGDFDMHATIPGGNYVAKVDMNGIFFLERTKSFEINHKLYGNTSKLSDRIIRTFHERENGTGALFCGNKGSGKSLLAKVICQRMAAEGYPTILINEPHVGDVFNTFLSGITQPCLVLFDEFEKIYDNDSQQQILSLFDGVFPTKKLYILTSNDSYRIDEHFRNRPGRLYYLINFKGLTEEFITDYCNDKLKATQYIEKIINLSNMYREFSFDILQALVEEMNRYDESPEEAISFLNVKPFDGDEQKYDVQCWKGDKKIETCMRSWEGNLLDVRRIYVSLGFDDDQIEGDGCAQDHLELQLSDITRFDKQGILFEKYDYRVIFTVSKPKFIEYAF